MSHQTSLTTLRWKRSIGLTVLSAAALLLSTGCQKIDTNLSLEHTSEGGKVTGEVSQMIDTKALSTFAESFTANMESSGFTQTEPSTGTEPSSPESLADDFYQQIATGVESSKEQVSGSLFEPEKFTIEPMREESYVGVKLTYSGVPLIDYETTMKETSTVGASTPGMSSGGSYSFSFTCELGEEECSETITEGGSGSDQGSSSENDMMLPTFFETEEGYEVKMANPFYLPPEAATEQSGINIENLEGFGENFTPPQYNVNIQMPSKVNDTNTPNAVKGKKITWTSEQLQNASTEQYVYATSGKSSPLVSPLWFLAALILVTPIIAFFGLKYFIKNRNNTPSEEAHNMPQQNSSQTSQQENSYHNETYTADHNTYNTAGSEQNEQPVKKLQRPKGIEG